MCTPQAVGGNEPSAKLAAEENLILLCYVHAMQGKLKYAGSHGLFQRNKDFWMRWHKYEASTTHVQCTFASTLFGNSLKPWGGECDTWNIHYGQTPGNPRKVK